MGKICKTIKGSPDIIVSKSLLMKKGCSMKGKLSLIKSIQAWLSEGVLTLPIEDTDTDTTYTFTEEDGVITVTDSSTGEDVGVFDICQIIADNCPETLTVIEVYDDGTFGYTDENGVEHLVDICDLLKGIEVGTGDTEFVGVETTVVSIENGECLLRKIPLPTKYDITGTVGDPFDPTVDCNDYNPGDLLIVGTNPVCPDFVYEVVIDSATGDCTVVMIQKPDGATGSTS